MQKTLVAAAAVLFVSAGLCLAQPAGITPDMIRRALPVEGAPKAEPGPYEVTSEAAFGASGFHIYRPAALDAFPKKDTLPVMVWGNGGCNINSTNFAGYLSTIASHGVLVIGTVAQEGAAQRQENADDMRGAIDWAEKENGRAGSPLNGKIAMDKVAVMGTSCGGFLSLTLGADPRVKTLGVFNSGIQEAPAAGQAKGKGGAGPQPTAEALPKIHGPVLLLNGGDVDFLMGASAATFELLNQVPAFYGSRHNGGHSATYFHPGGGEFANVASNWLMYTFKGDKKASAMFVGKDCGLCTNSNWDVKAKGIK